MHKLPLIIVEWDDCSTHTGWSSVSDDATTNAVHCISVGWKVKSNRRHLVITPIRDNYNKCDDRQIIPRGCITKIRRLE